VATLIRKQLDTLVLFRWIIYLQYIIWPLPLSQRLALQRTSLPKRLNIDFPIVYKSTSLPTKSSYINLHSDCIKQRPCFQWWIGFMTFRWLVRGEGGGRDNNTKVRENCEKSLPSCVIDVRV
jgi:hypothetical protein